MTLLSLALGFILAVTASDVGNAPPNPQPWEPIRVVSTSHHIDFPNEVVLTLVAEANTEITEVTLFYRLGRQTAQVYGYPKFTPSNSVRANFVIATGRSSYIPSGVYVRYHYVIRDSRGNTFESEQYLLEYKDPSFDWQRYRQGDIIILWHDRPRESVVAVATDVNQRLQSVKELLGLNSVEPMKAVIFNSSRESARGFPLVSQTAQQGHVFGGFAFGQFDLFVLAGLNTNGIIHEMTHLLVDESVNSPFAKIPAWLNEGLAMHFESNSFRRNETVEQALRDGNLLQLRSMGTVPGRPQDVRTFYAQAWSIVDYMISTYGRENMAALLNAINRGKSVEEAAIEIYGIGLAELERDWKSRLAGDTSLAPPADPGTVGTSMIIAGAVAITAIAMIIRWLRHLTNPSTPRDADI